MRAVLILLAAGLSLQAFAADIVVQRVNGDVSVRHGVTETWTKVVVGDVLRPDDTMKTGKKGSAVLVTAPSDLGKKTLWVPSEVIVDMSDIRNLSPEELMLKLTMEKVRSSSYEWKNEDLQIPHAAAVHGTDRLPASLKEADPTVGRFQLNGARLLFNNGFFATCALKGMEVFRHYPVLGSDFKNRLMVAEALEKANLRGEALSEYGSLGTIEGITPEQQLMVKARVEALRR